MAKRQSKIGAASESLDEPAGPPARPRILDANMKAESWFPDTFPGYIQYPETFTLSMHQNAAKLRDEFPDAEDREPILILDGDNTPHYFTIRNVHFAIRHAKDIEIKDVRNGKAKDIDLNNIGELPLEVAGWLGITATYYLNRHTKFSRLSSRGMEIQE